MSRWHFQLRFRLLLVGGMLFALIAGNRLGADQAVPRNPLENLPESNDIESDRVAEEILQIRQAIGPIWRGEDLEPPSDAESVPTDKEVIRAALLTQTETGSKDPEIIPTPSSPNRRATLRNAAHQLDITAHLLECQDLYDQADDLRATAQRFREQVRQEPLLHPPLQRSWKPVPGNSTD